MINVDSMEQRPKHEVRLDHTPIKVDPTGELAVHSNAIGILRHSDL